MEFRWPLLAALLLTACVTLPSALSQTDESGDAPPSSPSSSAVEVTLYVEGMVQVYSRYGTPSDGGLVNHMSYTTPEYSYTLVEASTDDSNGLPNEIPVAFSEEQGISLRTGDVVQAALKLKLSSEQASTLGLGSDDTGSGGQRRLLSEAHERARRMVLDFHETRRSLQEFMSLTDVLNSVAGITLSELPTAESPVIIGQSDTIKDLFIEGGKQQNVSSLTFVIKSTVCGLQPKLDARTVRRYWFDNSSDTSLTATLQQYHKACSYDQLVFRPENNVVIDIDIPCNGTSRNGLKYDLVNGYYAAGKSDMMNAVLALPQLAWEFLQKTNPTLAAKFDEYRRKIYIFPFGWKKPVDFIGLGSQGCIPGSTCLAVINSAPYGLSSEQLAVPVVFHEMGHNMGLSHAVSFLCPSGNCDVVETGDLSDVMGNGTPNDLTKTVLCLNAALAYKAGWAAPISGGHLSLGANLKPGMPQDFVLPSMSLNKTNMLRIITDASNPSIVPTNTNSKQALQRALFISYRVRGEAPASYDSGLGRDGIQYFNLNGYVWVHEFNETANGLPASSPSLMLAKLDTTRVANSFTQQLPTSLGNVTIRVKSKTPQAATVTVCRAIRVNEAGLNTCSDGLDNDCDGLVDNDDPDCNPVLKPPPPATSPSPPKPPVPRAAPKAQPSSPLRKAPGKKKRSPPPHKRNKKPPPKKNTQRG